MTTAVQITVPDHVRRVVVQTQNLTPDGWKNDVPVEYAPGTHTLHIWDTKRVSSIEERPPVADAPPNVVTSE